MNIETKKAVIYCRVSTKEQVDEGNSLVTQEKNCKEYALKNGYEITEIFIEQGESAKTANRTELQRLLNYCANKKNQINAVIAYKIDRISRNTDDYSQIRILLKRYHVEIKSTSEYFENTPAGRFMENIIANVAQFDNDVRSERCVGGMREAMKEGRYVWRAPIGYINAKIAGKSSIVPDVHAPVIKKAFELVAQNTVATESIRRMLFKKSDSNTFSISKTHFHRILRNPVYAGWIVKFAERHKGYFEPLVSKEIFEQAQRTLDGKKNVTQCYQVNHPDFPLRRFVYHPKGHRLTGSWSQGKTKRYPYYRYMMQGKQFPQQSLEASFAEFLNRFALSDAEFELLQVKAYEHFGKQTKEVSKRKKTIVKRLTELEQIQTELVQKNHKGIISDAMLKKQLELLELEEHRLKTTLYATPDEDIDFEQILPDLREYLKNPGDIWLKSPFTFKLLLQKFEFPLGVEYDGEKFRTPEICNIFKVKKDFLGQKFPKVDLAFENSDTPKTINTALYTKQNKSVENEQLLMESVRHELVALHTKMQETRSDSQSSKCPKF